MGEKRLEIKSLGFDIVLSAVYFTALLLSFLLLNANFLDGENNSAFVSCLVLVLPCALDSFKDFIGVINGKKSFDIVNIIISILLTILSVLLVIKICTDWNNNIWDNILIYSCSLSFAKYAIIFVFQIMELFRIKFGKEIWNG